MPDVAELGFWLKKVVSALVLLPAGPLFAIAVGALLVRRGRPRLGGALAADSERLFPPLDAGVALPADAAIVVLAGGMQQGALDYGGETVNAVTLARLRSAARLAARSHLPILVTGGTPLRAKTSEAEHMVDALEHDFGTPVRWVEKESLDTPDNARLSVPLLKAAGIGTAILVTDVEHMRRAKTLFEAAGMAVIAAPTDYYANGPITVLSFIPNSNALRRSDWSLHEWLGLWWSRLRTG